MADSLRDYVVEDGGIFLLCLPGLFDDSQKRDDGRMPADSFLYPYT